MQEKRKKMLAFLLLMVVAAMLVPLGKAKAAGAGLTVTKIDYETEELTVTSTSSDSYLYYSDAKRKKWECAGAFTAGTFVLDISWVSKTKDYVLVLKGDKSGEISVTLPKQDRSFKAKYNFLEEKLTYEGLAQGREVFWRKADSTVWQKVGMNGDKLDTATLEAFRRFYARGATLYLRAGQAAGTGTSAGARPSKEVKLALAKQASAPNLTVKHPGTVTVNDKQEYKLETAADWTAITEKTLDIAKVATAAYGANGVDTKILIRVAATEKKLPSASATLTVLAQEEAPKPETAGGNIEPGFANASTLLFTLKEIKDSEEKEVIIEKPSAKNPYEYTVVEAGEQLKDDATWTAITSETVKISQEKAPTGATVHIRKKGRLESTLVWQPESLSYQFVVGDYPGGGTLSVAADSDTSAVTMKADGVLSIVKQEGAPAKDLNFDIALGKEFSDTDVKEITCGGKQLKFTSTKDAGVIHVKITDTSAYETAVTTRGEEQAVKITLKNGEVIDKAVLTVLSGAKVKVKKTFTVTHGLTPGESYEFVVEPGLTFPKNGEEYAKTNVEKLTFMGEDITDYTLVTENGAYKITLTTAHFDRFFQNYGVDLDKEYPLTIVMSNGQKLTEGVSIKLHEDVTIENIISKSMTAGGLLEKEDKYRTFTITCSKDVKISNVGELTWNNQDISMQATKVGDVITITFETDAFKNLTPGTGTVTAPIIFTIKYGDGKQSQASQIYWLTLSPAPNPAP